MITAMNNIRGTENKALHNGQGRGIFSSYGTGFILT